jgi:hypothetical protein
LGNYVLENINYLNHIGEQKMTTYSEFKSKQFGDVETITFQGYQLEGKERKVQGRILLPFVGCLCVQDSPENPCPCTNDIFWIDKNAILAKKPIHRTSTDGVQLEVISVKENSDIRLESQTIINSSDLPHIISRECGSFDTDLLIRDSLTIEDHTTLVSIAMEHVGPILSKTRALRGTALSREIGITEPLAAFAASSISTRRVRDVAAHAVKLCETMNFDLTKPPKETKEVLARLDKIFDGARDFDDIQCQLQTLIIEHHEGSTLQIGLQTGLDMLVDGRDTIYSPNSRYHRSLAAIASEGVVQDSGSSSGSTSMSKKEKDAKDHAIDLGKADVAGATVGGAVGAAAAGVGAGPGAIAGGVTASFTTSVVKAVDAIVDWIF